jgi:predicted ATPase/DNA-binding CsgD family transcriptional regulator
MGPSRTPPPRLSGTGAPGWGLLPLEASTFIGRRRDLRRLVKLQAATRLLTLVGPGGSGKTRLAIRIARQRQSGLPGGAWFMDMAQDVRGTIVDVVTSGLRPADRRALLVVDTCDADTRKSADLVARLLEDNPQLQILATSREPLRLPDEVVCRLPLLSVPDERVVGLDQLRAIDSCQLFIERALTASPEDSDGGEYGYAIAQICRNLDGLPLATEIAALHMPNVGLAVLADLSTSEHILRLIGRRDAPPRHRSLRANLDWSYARLGANAQKVLRRLAVFGGDWTLEMASSVCPELDASDVAGIVAALQTMSLVEAVRRTGGLRFKLLETTRQYGRELLRHTGEWRWVARLHLEWCVALAESEPAEAMTQQHGHRLEREHAEIEVALQFAKDEHETELGLRLAISAFPLWYLRGRSAEGYAALRGLLEQPLEGVQSNVIAAARLWHTQLMLQRGEYAEAEALLRRLLEERPEGEGDESARGLTLMSLGNALLWSGQLEPADQMYAEAERLLLASKSPGASMAIYQVARVAWERGDLTRARDQAQRVQQLRLSRRSSLIARTHQTEALLLAEDGDTAAALRHLDEAERLLRRIDDVIGFIDLLTSRGHMFLKAGQTNAAHHAFVSAAALARGAGARIRVIRAIEGIACVIAESQPSLCVLLASAASASRNAMHAAAWPRDAARIASALSVARRHASKWPDAGATGVAAATYGQVWRLGSVLLESDAAAMAISTLEAQPPVAIADVPASLTGREWQVAQLFANGASPRQIADRLTLSRDTVRTHLDRATAKLGLHSRVQLAMWVARTRVPTAV